MKQRIVLILIGAIISCAYYLLGSPLLFQESVLNDEISNFEAASITRSGTIGDDPDFNSAGSTGNNGSTVSIGGTGMDESGTGTGRRLEISGLVVDERSQAIVNALVTEERYFYSTRSDSGGNYKLFVDMPDRRYPVLRFLRRGFRDKRIELGAQTFKDKSTLQLDIVLEDDYDSVSVDGWVGNDIGVGLGGLKIQITTRSNQGVDRVFQTVFSDERGYFTLEGIRSGEGYKLTVFPTPEYLYYVDEEFSVDQNTPQLKIVLESLDFIDIDGMIANSKAVPIPNFEIYIRNISTGTHVRKIVSDSSGFFSLQNFPAGEVSLSTQGPEYFKIKGLTLAPDEYRNLRLLVDRGDHYLSGWVTDESGVPIAKALVKLDARIEDGGIEYVSYRVKGTDSTGNFFFDSLGSGRHLLSIEAYGFTKQEIIHKFKSQTDKLHIILMRNR